MLSSILQRFKFSIERLVQTYEIPRDGCLHVGANFGQEAEIYDRLGFQCVVWIEGYRPYYSQLQKVISNRPNHTALNLMVSDVDGERVSFSVASNTGSSTVLATTQDWRKTFHEITITQSEPVICGRLDRALPDVLEPSVLSKLQFLVLDIEGSELKALRSMGRLLDNVKYALVEVSIRRIFVNGPLLSDMDRFMRAQSFERVYLKVSAGSGDALYRRVRDVRLPRRIWMRVSAAALELLAYLRVTDKIVALKKLVRKLTHE